MSLKSDVLETAIHMEGMADEWDQAGEVDPVEAIESFRYYSKRLRLACLAADVKDTGKDPSFLNKEQDFSALTKRLGVPTTTNAPMVDGKMVGFLGGGSDGDYTMIPSHAEPGFQVVWAGESYTLNEDGWLHFVP